MFKSSRVLVCAAVAALTAVAFADDLLVIDLSVANQVTITATSGMSAVTTSGGNSTGAYFENFYGVAGSALTATLVTGNLTSAANPSDNSPSLYRGGSGSDPGLNIWSFSTNSTINFTAGATAFVGSATWTLDPPEYADMLAGSSSGNIYFPADTFDDLPSAQVLGTYSVVPEPGALSLLACLGLGLLRNRR